LSTARVFAVDPGQTQSGWVLYDDDSHVADCGVNDNADMLPWIRHGQGAQVLAIEMVASYGMPVGREVFETVRWIGRFQQAWREPDAVRFVYRQDVKLALCNSPRANDASIRQALIDLFPPTGGGKTPQIGTKARPGPLYGVSSHVWAALGVAVVSARKNRAIGDLARLGAI
jgi:hypothetical protein